MVKNRDFFKINIHNKQD